MWCGWAPTMDSVSDPYLAAIAATFPDLERWRVRVEVPEEPDSRSQLAEDDAGFGFHAVSQQVRLSLASAGEHLRLARDPINAGILYPSAHFTVLRGALVGAAQAVWILAPDDSATRRNRGHAAIAHMYAELEKYYKAMDRSVSVHIDRGALGAQLTWIAERRERLSEARESALALNQTDFIGAALGAVYSDDDRRVAGLALWKEMSSDAHVLGWSTLQRAGSPTAVGADGQAEFGLVGSLSDLAQPFVLAHALLKRGWELFDERSSGEVPA